MCYVYRVKLKSVSCVKFFECECVLSVCEFVGEYCVKVFGEAGFFRG